MRISLIGLPGSGKSTVGRSLAGVLDTPFFDCDFEVEQQLGCSIRNHFEVCGEESFRDLEASVLLGLMLQPTAIISTGGGVVGRLENRLVLRGSSFVIYLHSMPDEIFKRLRHDRSRPLLQVADPMESLRNMYEVRDPLYREVAHFTIETGRPSASSLVSTIVMQLQLLKLISATYGSD
ncbi:MAG: shikimate kinase [Polaromonas sp.]|nr:shikimate kinase [Polaromonas sp.]